MSLISLILVLLLTFSFSALLVWRLLLPTKRSVAAIALLILWLCNLIVPVHCLALLNFAGLISGLRPTQLLLFNGITFVCGLACSSILGRRAETNGLKNGVDRSLALPSHVAIGVCLALSVYGILAARMAFSFPDSWDAVAYHYPVALRWLQESTMRITSASAWQASLPGNVEILDWLVLSTGHERILGLVQWPSVIVLLLVCLYLGRRVGKSDRAAWPVVTTALLIPMVATQSLSGYVDLFGTAVLFGSLTLLLEYYDRLSSPTGRPRPALLLTGGLGSGLAVGTKPVFWIYAAFIFINLLILVPCLCRKFHDRAWARVALFLAGVAVPSLFWFARAAMFTGNPFYPLAVHVGPLSLAGVRASQITTQDYYLSQVRHWAELFVYPWTEWKRSPGFLLMNYGPDDGLGGGFATFAIPGLAFVCWLAMKRRVELRVWLINLVILGSIWWFLLHKVVRFGLPMLILVVVLSAPLFEVLELRATGLYKLIYVLVFAATASVLAFEPIYTIIETVRHKRWSRAAYWAYPEEIDRLRPGSKILSLCEPTLNFALAGTRLTNRVIPDWDKPSCLTADCLQLFHVDYIIEKLSREKDRAASASRPPSEGLELYYSSSIPHGDKLADWRIWRVRRQVRAESPEIDP
jgi:4-amino-4-deoxy-L-arabinose transferase-like glycosyltransferase